MPTWAAWFLVCWSISGLARMVAERQHRAQVNEIRRLVEERCHE